MQNDSIAAILASTPVASGDSAASVAAMTREMNAERMNAMQESPALQGSQPGSFGNIVTDGISTINQQLLTSQTDLQQMAAGNIQNLHQVMIRMEESKLSFDLMMQVRNRLLEAYQDVMKMPV